MTNQSSGRKTIMAITGATLMLFLTLHAAMNAVALFSASEYNALCAVKGSNIWAIAATSVIAVMVLVHFAMAFYLVRQDMQAYGPHPYATSGDKTSSQDMFTLGTIIILGLALHLYNFWGKMMFAQITGANEAETAANGIYHLVNTFHGIDGLRISCIIYTVLYLVWIAAMWSHLNRGMWKGLQSSSLSSKAWFPRVKTACTIYSTIVMLTFAAVAITFCLGYTPNDFVKA
ncbi:succinate dehydrogenase/fumarate reductase cytochrome b subunit [Sodaliphilus sp.]|uniref:succinate dehydrogenase/fumarate reductase cytochrome b subunit n=1 Tax=Sodaliphilus sp. TaxID=2815818 RepID=UPI00388F4D26